MSARGLIHGMAALGILWSVGSASATPIISVDMDPSIAGIQSSLVVPSGSLFTIDVLISEPAGSPTNFDTIILEVSYNNGGAVLGPGPTGPIGGALAGNSAFTFDLFGFMPTSSGAPLGLGVSGPATGFASGTGAVGLLDPFFMTSPSPLTVFSIDFAALAPGTSSLLAAGSPYGSSELALGGSEIFADLASGRVTVEPAVPEPSSLVLFLCGLGGLAWSRRRLIKDR